MSLRLASLLRRSSNYLRRSKNFAIETLGIYARMEGADPIDQSVQTLLTINSVADLKRLSKGCDADNGGMSTVNLTLEDSKEINGPIGRELTGKFWGEMRLEVKPDSWLPRGGYAAMQKQPYTTLFGMKFMSNEFHEYIALRVRAGGDPRTHTSYFVNIQCETSFSTDLYQHRLFFRRPGQWETVYLPFKSFVRTERGHLTVDQNQMSHDIKTVGIALLGGHGGVYGKYELGIDSIFMVNQEDIKYTAPAVAQVIDEDDDDDELFRLERESLAKR